jgi:hypothetical protein
MIPVSFSRLLLVVFFAVAQVGVAQAKDPLPSWKDGANKAAIVAFVTAVTTPGKDFVPAADRLATFDMDGTLVPEKPDAAVWTFSLRYLAEVADANPALHLQPYEAVRQGDSAWLQANTYSVMAAAGAGLTEPDYRKRVEDFGATVSHPRYGVPWNKLFYAPMLELIAHLRANDFKVYIVSGSSQSFLRGFAKIPVGLPNAQMVGTQANMDFQGDGFTLNGSFRDLATVGAGKPLMIDYQIGQKPIFAFGNTSGDQAMFAYTTSNSYRHLAMWLDHDDAEREYVYDGGVTPLAGLLKVSMKDDFARVFPQ